MIAGIKSKIRNLHWSRWLSLVGLAMLFLGLRWNNYAAPLIRDEGEYAYAAQLLIQGIAPYQHAFIQKPPGVFYSYVFSYLLLPDFFWSPRLLASLFAGLAAILLGVIVWLEFGEGLVLPVLWLATPMALLPRMDQWTASVEMFLLLPLMATVAVYCYSRQHGHKNKHWLAAGFLAATTLLYKYTALPVLAFVFMAWLFEIWRRGESAKVIFRALASAAAGGILALAAGLAFFLIQDGGRAFWECTVVFNRYYAVSNIFGLAYLWRECKDLWVNWWILFLIPWAVLWQWRPRLWFWLGIFICAVLATNGSCYGQYYIIIMPFWALLTVLGIRAMASRLSAWKPQLSPWAGSFIAIVVCVLVIRPDVPWMLYSRERFAHEKLEESPFIEARVVAAQVARMSSPDDFIYVAGSEPEILYYARRFSPTRFITSYALMDPNPLAPGYQNEAIHDLREHPPKLIVFVQVGNSWTRQSNTPPEFISFIGHFLQGYDQVGGYVKTDAQPGYWTTNLSVAEFRNCSLVLYQRKPGT